MRVLLGVLSLMILLNIDGALLAGANDNSTLREGLSENFNPYDISYEEMGALPLLGTTIVSNYAGSSYFFGTGNLWNAVSAASGAPDNSGAFAQLFPNDTSRFLYTRDFMFDIPCNATITNLTVRITRQNSTAIDVSDAMVSLYNPLTLSTSPVNLADPNVWVEDGSWETITYSHANWGENLTPELVNNRRFGIIVTAQQLETAGLARAFIDAIEIEACYNVGAPFSEPITFVADKVDACFDEGYIDITATGGSGSYEYSIDNGINWQTNPLFSNLSSGDYTIVVRNTDGTCATERFYCNLSSDDRILQPGDAIVACATFPGNRVTLAIEKVQPFNELYSLGEVGYDISYLIPNHPYEWEVDDLQGEVFSFDVDKTRNVYTAVTMLYDLVPGFDVVPYVNKIDAFSGQAYILNVLPGDSGAGGVEYDTICEQIYISNLSDGMIYRMDPNNGVILSTFDPLSPDNGADGIAPLGERVLALGWNHVEQRLYYSVWASDFNKTGIRNSIRSIAIDPISCDFDVITDRLEYNLPWTSEYGDPLNPEDYSMPVGDIEFSTDGATMLLSETGFDSGVPRSQPHESRLMRYLGSTGSWVLQSTPPSGNTYLEYELGEVSAGLNSRGGVDFANSGFTNAACSNDLDQFVVATADALRGADCNTLGCIYGLQYLPVTGGNPPNSVLLDIARDVGSQQKGVFGDVDIIQGCFTDEFCCPEVDSPAPDEALCVGVGTLNNVDVTSQADSMSLVYFTSVPADSIAIYDSGTPLDTVQLIACMGTLDISGLPIS
ncbi:MAG: hypothetical protein HKN09_06300, partial [Saprospiraceae bacterium]|nr:hypothetical protein [Saprospiraceae bacterium]